MSVVVRVLLQYRYCPTTTCHDGHHLQLFTHRADVDAVNGEELTRLDGEEVVFRAQDEGQADVLRTGCAVRKADHVVDDTIVFRCLGKRLL